MKKLFVISTLIMLVLSACGPAATAQPTQDVGAIQTAAVKTAQAQATATPLPATATSVPATATAAPATATATSAPAATATKAAVAVCDAASFITDVTVPDNTVFKPGEIFTKTWQLKNVGTCTWDDNYLVTAESGDGMTQSTGYHLSKVANKSTVAPGETVNISIDMQASNKEGEYTTYWQIQNGAGTVLPVAGGYNNKTFYVKIKVKDENSGGGSGGGISDVSTQIVQEQGSGAVCSANTTYYVYVNIKADGATTAEYRISLTDDSGQVPDGTFDGFASPEVSDSLTFNGADTQKISLGVVGPYSYPDKITVRVKVNGKIYPETMVSCQ